jgi:hypothetical protein
MGVFSLKKYCRSKKRTSKKGDKKRTSKKGSKKRASKRKSKKSSFGRKSKRTGKKNSFGRKRLTKKPSKFGRAPSLNNIMGNYGPALFPTFQEYTGANSAQRAQHLSNIPVGLRNSFYI